MPSFSSKYKKKLCPWEDDDTCTILTSTTSFTTPILPVPYFASTTTSTQVTPETMTSTGSNIPSTGGQSTDDSSPPTSNVSSTSLSSISPPSTSTSSPPTTLSPLSTSSPLSTLSTSSTSLSLSTSLPSSTSLPLRTSQPPTSGALPHRNVGAIAGGTVGGFVALASLILIALLWLARRRRHRIAPSAAYRAAYGTTPPPIYPRSDVSKHHLLPSQNSNIFSVSNTRSTVFDGHQSSVVY